MGDSLERYRDKRDPSRTNEPFAPLVAGSLSNKSTKTRQGEYVVHLHDATRRHYDLRIEVGGVLESFAVPRGPSLNPKDKRLAVHTEAHPLDYTGFEAVIPEGGYGAGPMIAWDRGRVVYPRGTAEEGLAAGKLELHFSGLKLRGAYTLVRIKPKPGAQDKPENPPWLLIKRTDAYADRDKDLVAAEPRSVFSGLTVEELPERDALSKWTLALVKDAPVGEVDARKQVPMACSLDPARIGIGGGGGGGADGQGEHDVKTRALSREGWLYELKLDGVRIVADKRGSDVSLTYRTQRAATASFREIASALTFLPTERVVLDGEIVAFDDAGRPSFQKLSRRIQARRPLDRRQAQRSVPVVFVVFDILALGEHDLRGWPLSRRKEVLTELVRGKGFVRTLEHTETGGPTLHAFCEANRLEGVVAKRAASTYQAGPTRSEDWVKIKCEREHDFVVYGYTEGEGSRAKLGALLVATRDPSGTWVSRGKVGSGIADADVPILIDRLGEVSAHTDVRDAFPGHYVSPKKVVGVRYAGWTEQGRLRFPVYRGLRDDVTLEEVTASPPPEDAILLVPEVDPREEASRVVGRVKLTNQSKVFWPASGYTKGDLCGYYEAVADTILPHLYERPVTLVRYPDGIDGKHFFQWRMNHSAPTWLRALPLRSMETDGKETHTFLLNDRDSLLYVINHGCIPIHVIATRREQLDRCDFVTVDFDVGEASLRDAITLARSLRDLLEDVGLTGFPKTSGRTGLHVLVPVAGLPWDAAKQLVELLGRLVTDAHPDIATMLRTKERRGARVYVDCFQTGRLRTIVAPYAVRAVPGARVSTPLHWDEVGPALDPAAFNIDSVIDRLSRSVDPMKEMHLVTPDFAQVTAALSERVKA